MPSRASRLTPIGELPDNFDDGFIAWQIPQNPYTEDSVGINLGRTERAIHRLGFSALRVTPYTKSDDDLNIETSITGITGVNPDGSAVATGSAKASRKKTNYGSLEHDPDSGLPICVVAVDQAVTGSLISDLIRKRGDSRPKAWAKAYDYTLRSGIADAAVETTLERVRTAIDKEPEGEFTFGFMFRGLVALESELLLGIARMTSAIGLLSRSGLIRPLAE